jgi:hypothetical protein
MAHDALGNGVLDAAGVLHLSKQGAGSRLSKSSPYRLAGLDPCQTFADKLGVFTAGWPLV